MLAGGRLAACVGVPAVLLETGAVTGGRPAVEVDVVDRAIGLGQFDVALTHLGRERLRGVGVQNLALARVALADRQDGDVTHTGDLAEPGGLLARFGKSGPWKPDSDAKLKALMRLVTQTHPQ